MQVEEIQSIISERPLAVFAVKFNGTLHDAVLSVGQFSGTVYAQKVSLHDEAISHAMLKGARTEVLPEQVVGMSVNDD